MAGARFRSFGVRLPRRKKGHCHQNDGHRYGDGKCSSRILSPSPDSAELVFVPGGNNKIGPTFELT